MARVKIHVTLKEGILDVQGRTALDALKSLGYASVADVRIGKYIQLEVEESANVEEQVREMCERLLTNPVIEDYTFEVVK